MEEIDVEKYIHKLNEITSSKNNVWINEKTRKEEYKDIKWNANLNSLKGSYIIQNDSNLSKNDFLKRIYFNLIIQNYNDDLTLNTKKKEFLSGFLN